MNWVGREFAVENWMIVRLEEPPGVPAIHCDAERDNDPAPDLDWVLESKFQLLRDPVLHPQGLKLYSLLPAFAVQRMACLTHLVPQKYPQWLCVGGVWAQSILKLAFPGRFHDTYVDCGADQGHTLDKVHLKLVPDLPSNETDGYQVLEVEA
jgi:hypothetical protein